MIWTHILRFAFLTLRADFLLFMVVKHSGVFLLAFGEVAEVVELGWKLLACPTKAHLRSE